MNLKVKYRGLVLLDVLVLITNYLVVAWVLSLFTRAQPDLDEAGEQWGWWFGTWDNPPQGDSRWLREGWFPGYTDGWKGYLNRVGWLYRNPGYGFQKWAGVPYSDDILIQHSGNCDISDKYRRPGSYTAHAINANGQIVAFEYYAVIPWKLLPNKCFRIRLGWKIMTDKYERYGFATLVDTVHPFKSYGE